MSEAATRECPFCAETIKAAATLCRFCGRELPPPVSPAAPAAATPPAPPAASASGAVLHEAELLDLLIALVQRSMVVYEEDERGQGRYRLLETVRQYARDRLLEGGEAVAVRERHRDWCLALAEQGLGGESETARMDRLEVEHDNLRTALAPLGAGAQGQGEAGLRLAGALVGFWDLRGHYTEGREHLAGLLAQPGAEARTAARARALQGAGWLARHQGDYAAGQALLEESLTVFRELGLKQGVAASLGRLGRIAGDQGDLGTARGLLEESLAIFRELDKRVSIAWTLHHLGSVVLGQRDNGAARALSEESLAIFRELGNQNGIAWSLHHLGMVAYSEGDHGAARALFEESLAIHGQLGEKQGSVTDLEGLAAVAVAQAQPARAARLFGAAEGLREAMGTPLPPADRAEQDRSVGAARAALGEEAFAAAWTEGRAMSLDDAVAFALQGEGTATGE